MSTISTRIYIAFKYVIYVRWVFESVKSSVRILKMIWGRKSISCGCRWKHLAIYWLPTKQPQANLYLLYFIIHVLHQFLWYIHMDLGHSMHQTILRYTNALKMCIHSHLLLPKHLWSAEACVSLAFSQGQNFYYVLIRYTLCCMVKM